MQNVEPATPSKRKRAARKPKSALSALAERLRPARRSESNGELVRVTNPVIAARAGTELLVVRRNADCQGFITAALPWDLGTTFPLTSGEFCRGFPPHSVVRYDDLEVAGVEPVQTTVYGFDIIGSVRYHISCNKEFYLGARPAHDEGSAEAALLWARAVNWHLFTQCMQPAERMPPEVDDSIPTAAAIPDVVFPWDLRSPVTWLDTLRPPDYTSQSTARLIRPLVAARAGGMLQELHRSLTVRGSSYPNVAPARILQVASLLSYLALRVISLKGLHRPNVGMVSPLGSVYSVGDGWNSVLMYEDARNVMPNMYFGLQAAMAAEKLEDARVAAIARRDRRLKRKAALPK